MELSVKHEEMVLRGQIDSLVEQAHEITVDTDDDVALATDITRGIKAMSKSVKDYFEPMRLETKAAYDAVVAAKKEFTDPLDAAERELKGKITEYDAEKRRKAAEAEAALRKAALEEAEKKRQAALEAEKSGDALAAEMAQIDAEALEATAQSVSVKTEDAKASGMSRRKAWKITGIDSSKVPISIAGAEIRPVDERAVMALIKATGGTIQIPGIAYEETEILSIR